MEIKQQKRDNRLTAVSDEVRGESGRLSRPLFCSLTIPSQPHNISQCVR